MFCYVLMSHLASQSFNETFYIFILGKNQKIVILPRLAGATVRVILIQNPELSIVLGGGVCLGSLSDWQPNPE